MDKLKLELENCYGIQKLSATIDYSSNNVAVIYAPNGTMLKIMHRASMNADNFLNFIMLIAILRNIFIKKTLFINHCCRLQAVPFR